MALPLILASSSPYRRILLERLGLPFACASPDCDESPFPDEGPRALAERLAVAKARALTGRFPHHLIVGSDQVATIHGEPIGKPGTEERAFAQLRQQSGQTVQFHTAVALLDSATDRHLLHVDTTSVVFRHLDDGEIRRYLSREQPYDCAGSFKMEGLGIALFERIESVDPTALMGLPLIALAHLLREFEVRII